MGMQKVYKVWIGLIILTQSTPFKVYDLSLLVQVDLGNGMLKHWVIDMNGSLAIGVFSGARWSNGFVNVYRDCFDTIVLIGSLLLKRF